MAAAFANVAVLTALLVYFGWTRSEVQAQRLGIDESLLGMSTRDYLLRSVRPVLVLLLVIAVTGLLWLLVDRWTVRRISTTGPSDRITRQMLRLMPTGLVALPALAWLAGYAWPAIAFVAFPLCCAAGLLLMLYAFHLRQLLPDADPLPAGRQILLHAFVAIVTGIGLFTAAANYATVEGVLLADEFASRVTALPSVVVYSPKRLHLNAPGVSEELLPAPNSAYLVRYVGLRLLERSGGNYFLVSDGWSPDYGVVVVLADDAAVRLEFVRDIRAGARSPGMPPRHGVRPRERAPR